MYEYVNVDSFGIEYKLYEYRIWFTAIVKLCNFNSVTVVLTKLLSFIIHNDFVLIAKKMDIFIHILYIYLCTSTASKIFGHFLILVAWGTGEAERVPKSFEQN